MVKKVVAHNFTVFTEETFNFSHGLNVVIGENAVGKSHLLKLAYAMIAVSHQASKETITPNKQIFQKMISEKLVNVFRPDGLGRLVQRAKGRKKCEIHIFFDDDAHNFAFGFSTVSKTDVQISLIPRAFITDAPIFFPTREVISIFPGFAALYRDRHVEFDETYYDLCLALEAVALRGPRLQAIKSLIDPLEAIIDGSVKVENGRFYLAIPGKGKMEIALVAEGMRKIAMLAYLITNGALKDKGMLFWDEPETNLNPRLIKLMAQTILTLTENGIQVFIATHSLFLLRELEILTSENVPQRFFALSETDTGIQVSRGDAIDEVDPIVSLDEALMQSDRFLGDD